MRRIWSSVYNQFSIMANLPPRKISSSSKSSKQDTSPLQILLQMGFSRHRALKALAATGNRSVQLASDWLLTHVNDTHINVDEPREYILYASPTGPLLAQLLEFWEKSKNLTGWNGAHNNPPHITLVSFFKAPDETSLQLAKAVKHVVETVGDPPSCPLKLEPYISHNYMGLFVPDEHAEYLKKMAVQYVKLVSSALGVSVDTYEHLDALGTCFPWCAMPQEKTYKSINLEPHVKSLHISLAYRFDEAAYDALRALVDDLQPLGPAGWQLRLYSRDPRFAKHQAAYDALRALVDDLQPLGPAGWQLRLYSRDPRFAKHQVHKVTQGYAPQASDELELVLGDYIYVDDKELEASSDGWVHGTSWLTGVTGCLPAVYTQRVAESDAWTLHRAISLGNQGTDSKSESDSNTDGEMSYPHEDAAMLGHEKSEEFYKDWGKYWETVQLTKTEGILNVTHGSGVDWKDQPSPEKSEVEMATNAKEGGKQSEEDGKRWVFAMRHGERVDLTYGHWVQFCFDDKGKYVRKDLNMPLSLGERVGGAESYAKDTPLTRVGRFQAQLVGEAMRLAGISVKHVYASAALRCVETADEFLKGLQADPSVKIRVEPGLFEFKLWHMAKGLAPFMTPQELLKAGYNVDVDYKPYINMDVDTTETLEEFYGRNEKVMHLAVNDTAAEGGNVIFVGHASTLDMAAFAMQRKERIATGGESNEPSYQIGKHLLRVPYCALAAIRGAPWRLVAPPVPPCINSSSGRFDWKILQEQPQSLP